MKMKIEKISESEMMYIRRRGSYGVGNIQTMEKLKTWAMANGLLNDESIIVGIPWDNPATTPPQDCRYDAGLFIRADQQISDDAVQRGRVSPGAYAVFEIEHTAEALEQTWSELFSELSKQGYHLDNSRPIMERYAGRMVKKHRCEICVPII